jgi:hypothetical protein
MAHSEAKFKRSGNKVSFFRISLEIKITGQIFTYTDSNTRSI